MVPNIQVKWVGKIGIITLWHAHLLAISVSLGLIHEGTHHSSYKLPEIFPAAEGLCFDCYFLHRFVKIAIAGICLIHIVISIGCLYYRWVVHIGKIPLTPESKRLLDYSYHYGWDKHSLLSPPLVGSFGVSGVGRSWFVGFGSSIGSSPPLLQPTAKVHASNNAKFIKMFLHCSLRLVGFYLYIFSGKGRSMEAW